MLIEQPPLPYRLLSPGAIWRIIEPGKKVVYLTFDDGPQELITPKVLDILDRYQIKATFFMVGENVSKYPRLKDRILKCGHSIGNHTMHHIQGLKCTLKTYLCDVEAADRLIGSRLFRPPHGIMRLSQHFALKKRYRIVMYDVVSRDYSNKIDSNRVFENIKRYTRNGSIIVFHDSLKAADNMLEALPSTIEWLKQQGYEFARLPMQ